MNDLAGRLAHRVQLTSDGHKPYLRAVEDAFGADIDYSMLVKLYGREAGKGEVRYLKSCLELGRNRQFDELTDFDVSARNGNLPSLV